MGRWWCHTVGGELELNLPPDSIVWVVRTTDPTNQGICGQPQRERQIRNDTQIISIWFSQIPVAIRNSVARFNRFRRRRTGGSNGWSYIGREIPMLIAGNQESPLFALLAILSIFECLSAPSRIRANSLPHTAGSFIESWDKQGVGVECFLCTFRLTATTNIPTEVFAMAPLLSPSYHHRHGEREMREFVDYIITNYLQGSIQQSRWEGLFFLSWCVRCVDQAGSRSIAGYQSFVCLAYPYPCVCTFTVNPLYAFQCT